MAKTSPSFTPIFEHFTHNTPIFLSIIGGRFKRFGEVRSCVPRTGGYDLRELYGQKSVIACCYCTIDFER